MNDDRNIFRLGRRSGDEDQLTEMLVWLVATVPMVGDVLFRLAADGAGLDVTAMELSHLGVSTQQSIAHDRMDAWLWTESLSLVVESKLNAVYGDDQLRKYADWLAGKPIQNPDYMGWGYRHIKAGHGWSLTDDADTRDALGTMGFRSYTKNALNAYVFYGPKYAGTGGATCRREVLVEYGTAVGESGPKGIITSFGRNIDTLGYELKW